MRICIVGKGRVGLHLTNALKDKAEIKHIDSRNLQEMPGDFDVYLLCVSDSAIREVGNCVSGKIKKDCIIAHTSGSTPISELEGMTARAGVLYPLQTFSKDVTPEYSDIPVFIEGSDSYTEAVLEEIAHLFTDKVHFADSDKRERLHLASVISCNFTNHLWALAYDYLEKNGLDFSLLYPLLKETLRKAVANSPGKVQTGPASRGDIKTLNRHMDLLKDEVRMKEIYSILSQSIINYERN